MCESPRTEILYRLADPLRKGSPWEVHRCLKCRYGWTWPLPLPDQLAAYYPAAYLGRTRRTLAEFGSGSLQKTRSWRRETEKVNLLEHFVRGGRILDVGCADAKFLLALDGARWRRSGVEFIGEVVDMVREAIPDLDLHQGDIESPKLEEGEFDAVTFWHVLEHLYEPERVLARVFRLLRPGGWLLISVPNLDSFQQRLFREHWYAFDVPRHLHHFSPQSLNFLLQRAGLKPSAQLFFSKMYNMHQLKYSLIHWSEERFSSRVPYYLFKPLLFPLQWMESFGYRYGTLTTIAKKP